jgi:hypothetical protein
VSEQQGVVDDVEPASAAGSPAEGRREGGREGGREEEGGEEVPADVGNDHTHIRR